MFRPYISAIFRGLSVWSACAACMVTVIYSWKNIYIYIHTYIYYSVIQKDGLNFVRLYFPKYTWYVNDLHNI